MSDMASDLAKIRKQFLASIEHASGHAQRLSDLIQEHNGLPDVTVVAEISDDRMTCNLRAEIPDFPLSEWSRVFKDAIHALRTGLEHVAWGLATLDGNVPSEPQKVSFPIATTAKQWKSRKSGIAELPLKYRNVIEMVQPMHRDIPDDDPLAVLSSLDNTTKHRFFVEPMVDLQRLQHSFSMEFATDDDAARAAADMVTNIDLDQLASGGAFFTHRSPVPISKVLGELGLEYQIKVAYRGDASMSALGDLAKIFEYAMHVVEAILQADGTDG